MHRQDRLPVAAPDDQVTSVPGFKRAALTLQPAFELPTRHTLWVQQMCCDINTCVAVRSGVPRQPAQDVGRPDPHQCWRIIVVDALSFVLIRLCGALSGRAVLA